MKKAVSFLAFFLLISAMAAPAGDFSWKGSELQTNIIANLPVSNRVILGTMYTRFECFSSDIVSGFFYAGPEFTLKKSESFSWWIGPKLGIATNWFEDDAFLFSVWSGLSAGKWNLFVEGDRYSTGSLDDYYFIYNLDYAVNLKEIPFVFGAGAEQINDEVHFGPRAGFSRGALYFEIQHYLFLREEVKGHTLRFIGKLIF